MSTTATTENENSRGQINYTSLLFPFSLLFCLLQQLALNYTQQKTVHFQLQHLLKKSSGVNE